MGEPTDKEKRVAEARAMIKAVYDDQLATINGRDYTFLKCTHVKRLEVFAFMSEHAKDMEQGKLGFLSSPEWRKVEKTINSVVSYDGHTMNAPSMVDHWDNHPGDYIMWIQTCMGALCFPLQPGNVTS